MAQTAAATNAAAPTATKGILATSARASSIDCGMRFMEKAERPAEWSARPAVAERNAASAARASWSTEGATAMASNGLKNSTSICRESRKNASICGRSAVPPVRYSFWGTPPPCWLR